jgi:tetratricopeptide (TPR) repeat protein
MIGCIHRRQSAPKVTRICWVLAAVLVPLVSIVGTASWVPTCSALPLTLFPSRYSGFGLPRAVALQALTSVVTAVWLLHIANRPTRTAGPVGSAHYAPWYGLKPIVDVSRSPVAVAALAFLVSQLLGSAWSLSPRISFWGGYEARWQGAVSTLCGYVIVLTLPLGIRNRKDGGTLVSAILWGAFAVGAWGIVQRFYPDFPIPMWPGDRVGSILGNPISLGAYLVLVLPPAAGRWIGTVAHWRAERSTKAALWAVVYTVLLAVLLVCLLFTGSRGPWLGAVGAALVFFGLLAWRSHRPRLVLALVVLLVGAATLLLLVNLPQTPMEALRSDTYLSRLRFSRDPGSISERMLVWEGAWELIRKRPAIGGLDGSPSWIRHLVGYGPETTGFTFWTAYPVELFHLASSTGFFDRVHNRLLEVALTTGVLGVITYLAFIAALGLGLLRVIRCSESLRESLVPAALLSAIVGHVLQLQTGIETIETQTLVWIYAGLAVAFTHSDLRQKALGDQAQSHTSAEVIGDSASARQRGVAYVVLAVAAGAILVVGIAARGVRQVAAASLYFEEQHSRPALSEAERLDLLNRAIALAPHEARYRRAKFELHYGLAQSIPDTDVAMKSQVLQFGAEAIEQAIDLAPYEAFYQVNRAEIYGYWARSIEPSRLMEASESWKRAIELSPRDADLRAGLGLLYLDTGHLKEAEEVLRAAIDVDPVNGESYYVLGLVYRDLGLPELAQQQFQIGYDVDKRCVQCQAELRSPPR